MRPNSTVCAQVWRLRHAKMLPAFFLSLLFATDPLLAQQEQCSVQGEQANYDFSLQDMHGRELSLTEYEGKVLLLDFWATWCAPCRIEIPGFLELLAEYQDKGFAVVGVSVNDSPEAMLDFAEELGIGYPLLVGDGRDDIKDAYGPLHGFPTTVIIDRQGRICHRHVGYTDQERFEQDLLRLL